MLRTFKTLAAASAFAAAGLVGCAREDYPQFQQLIGERDTGSYREITVANAPDSLMEFLNQTMPDATINRVEERSFGADNRYYKVFLTTRNGELRVINYNDADKAPMSEAMPAESM